MSRRNKIEYSDKLGQEICDAVATSTLGLIALCKQNPHWPCSKIIKRWRYDPSINFGALYARAKQCQIDSMVERIFELTKDKKKGYLTDNEGKVYADQTYLTKLRVEVDSIKWLASKLAPKIYGDKVVKEDDKDKHETSINELE